MMLVILSAFSGALGAMGIGGGVILIPVLTNLFELEQKQAQFINLIYFVPVALCALIIHKRNGNLELKKAVFMALGGVVGAFVGSGVACRINVKILRKLFGVFLLLIGISQLNNHDGE